VCGTRLAEPSAGPGLLSRLIASPWVYLVPAWLMFGYVALFGSEAFWTLHEYMTARGGSGRAVPGVMNLIRLGIGSAVYLGCELLLPMLLTRTASSGQAPLKPGPQVGRAGRILYRAVVLTLIYGWLASVLARYL
jgi:hypothetical protein